MMMNDKRGRMVRAFPVFYMIMIDEGRDIGIWHLHDNFYNVSAISELQIVKSRKIAADTANITMSNMFASYTTDDEDIKDNYIYSFKDAWNSIFSPRKYFTTEERRRSQQNEVNRVRLQPGIRLHIRLGYSADASELPIVFNGVVAEVSAGDVVQIVAQGDGIELMNPILSNVDGEDIQNQDDFILSKILKNWLTNGASPRTILTSLLTTKGGFIRKEIGKYTDGRFFNLNPYGIVHFGDQYFNKIFSKGECVQNIYEATSKPSWADGGPSNNLFKMYETEAAPKISTHVFDKSYWDIMNICASVSPDFIASVVPFGFRSSIFYGAPRYYYAYEYTSDVPSGDKKTFNITGYDNNYSYNGVSGNKVLKLNSTSGLKDGDVIQFAAEGISNNFTTIEKVLSSTSILVGTKEQIDDTWKSVTKELYDGQIIREKRKPFRQYHIYTSYSDIVGNAIKTSDQDVRTCAIGLYTATGWLGREHPKRVGPMWADFDIYPEKQKTMTVDTQFIAKVDASGALCFPSSSFISCSVSA
jgi:hypothetical protein